MACTTITTIAKDCLNNTGGLQGMWVFDEEGVALYTPNATTGFVDALDITTDSGVTPTAPISFFLKPYTANYTEVTTEEFTNGNSTTTTTLAVVFNRREAAKSRALKILGEGQRYLGIVVLDGNGIYWYIKNARLSENGEGSGTARTDGSKYSVTFIAENEDTNYAISEADALLFIANGYFVAS